jgi:hypothetical protein
MLCNKRATFIHESTDLNLCNIYTPGVEMNDDHPMTEAQFGLLLEATRLHYFTRMCPREASPVTNQAITAFMAGVHAQAFDTMPTCPDC